MMKIFRIWNNKSKEVVEVVAKKVGKEWMAKCPMHDDHEPSLSISEEKGLYNCFGCGWSGRLYDPNYVNKKSNSIIKTYDYMDKEGILKYQVVRYSDKSFKFRRPDGSGGWIYNLEGVKKILYMLPELLESSKTGEDICIVEGEKDVDSLCKMGAIATTNPMGAEKWKEVYNQYLKGRNVVLIPDNDAAGRSHCMQVGKSFQGIAKTIKYLELPRLKEKEDISDWIEKGGTKRELVELVKNAPFFKCVDEDPGINIEGKFEVRRYSEYVKKNYCIRYDKFKRLWRYNEKEGLWSDDGDVFLDSILRRKILNQDHIKDYYIQEIIKDVKGLSLDTEGIEEPPPYLIPFKDKIYDLKNDSLLEYKPDFFFVNKIRVTIDTETNKCPKIDKIFEDLVGEEKKELLYEIAGYCLYRDYPSQKIFIIYGDGSNGKSTYAAILARLIGTENVSAINIKDFRYNYRFAAGQLHKKLLNISGEIEDDILKDTSILKQATGGDLIKCEKKFKEPFLFKNYAKMIVLTNNIPITTDKTTAYYRRIFLIEFPNEFKPGENQTKKIFDKIPPKEYEALAKKSIDALRRLKQNNFTFTKEEEMKKVIRKYEKLSNPLLEFLEEYTVYDIDCNITVRDFKSKFLKYQKDNKLPKWTSQKINKVMNLEGYERQTVKNLNGSSCKAWMGLRWKS